MSKLATQTRLNLKPGDKMRWVLRAAWIAIRLVAVIVLLRQGGTFFYQGF